MKLQNTTLISLVRQDLKVRPRKWLVTGCAGFIGSNLLETLLRLNQTVVGLDNFATGHQHNLDEIHETVGSERFARFQLIRADIRDINACREAVHGVEHVLHQAALGSVPRSLEDPITVNAVNVGGFLNMLVAARDAGIASFVYAASSSTYGDHPGLPKIESRIGRPLSPYAVTKYVDELYADVFARCYGFRTIGLRYFNVFGKRQDPDGAYAAVIPKWIASMIRGDTVTIHGDGTTSRDFCYIDNAVQANLLAATVSDDRKNEVYNVAVGGSTTLNQLFDHLKDILAAHRVAIKRGPAHIDFRKGDVMHSQADIGKAITALGYTPTHDLRKGLEAAMPWYLQKAQRSSAA